MTTQRLCGLFLFAATLLLALSIFSPRQRAVAQSGPTGERASDRTNHRQSEGNNQRDTDRDAARKPELTPKEKLGKLLFSDTNLSSPRGQACASCHDAATGFTSPSSRINAGPAIIPGAVSERAGNRKPPSVAYAGDSPVLRFEGIDGGEGRWVGGLFCDGRATGQTLGDPLAEQATQPFTNPVEQNLRDNQALIRRVAQSNYAKLFEKVWGPGALDAKDVEATIEKIGRSIAAYERSFEVSAFTSKYDAVLRGQAKLNKIEALGLELFNGKAACFFCHSSAGDALDPPLFTDFTYHNIGTPKNLKNPFYDQPRRINPDGARFIDPGLGGFLKSAGYDPDVYEPEWGKHKVPTLRNVDKRPNKKFVKAYGHNGTFKSLEEIVSFYNTRDVGDWPKPEVAENVNPFIGDLGLTDEEEAAVVAFLKTLSDGYKPPHPRPTPSDREQDKEQKQDPKQGQEASREQTQPDSRPEQQQPPTPNTPRGGR